MDAESGDYDKDGLTSEWGGKLRQDWLGWWNEYGSWFQRRRDAYLNERSVIFNKEMVGETGRCNGVTLSGSSDLPRELFFAIPLVVICVLYLSQFIEAYLDY